MSFWSRCRRPERTHLHLTHSFKVGKQKVKEAAAKAKAAAEAAKAAEEAKKEA